MFPEYSRSRLQDWIARGFVTLDGRQPKPREAVRGGERVVVEPQPDTAVTSAPEAMSLDILLETDDFLILDKPAGLVVHPGAGNTRGTLMNGLLHHAPQLAA